MAQDSYAPTGKKLTGGWKLGTSYVDKESGYLATSYRKVDEKGNTMEWAYVFAGTAITDPGDVINDAQQEFGSYANQYGLAVMLGEKFSKSHENIEVTFIGHSLGGGLAKIASKATSRGAITFNAARVQKSDLGYYMTKEAIKNNNPVMENYHMAYDMLYQVTGTDSLSTNSRDIIEWNSYSQKIRKQLARLLTEGSNPGPSLSSMYKQHGLSNFVNLYSAGK